MSPGTALLLLLLCCTAARADGGFFITAERIGRTVAVASAKQEAMLITDGEAVQVILRTHFRAGPTELAWVVPVPAEPTAIGTVSESVFTKMDELTAPQFFEQVYRGKGWACGCSAGGDQYGEDAIEPKVKVIKSGEAGVYEFVVLAASDGAALTDWLNKNHYAIPATAAATFEHYAKNRWHWLAMRVRAAASAAVAAGNAAPQPITYTYKSDKLVFPLVISQVSADTDNEIVLHIAARQRMVCANWRNAVIDRGLVTRDAASPSGTNYERLFAHERSAADGRVFVTEYAQRWGPEIGYSRGEALAGLSQSMMSKLGKEMCITRLRAVVSPAAMDRDVELTVWGGSADAPEPWVSNRFVLREASRAAVPVLPLAVASLSFGCAFCSRNSRRGRAAFAALAAMALCMV